MRELAINLFGTFQAALAGRPLCFPTDKCRALLAYLAVEANRPHRREYLAAQFWPDQPEPAARANLRQTLHRLRAAFGPDDNPTPHLLVSYHDIQFNPESDYRLDAAEFIAFLRAYRSCCGPGSSLCRRCQKALQAAVALYQGDFMAGFTLPGNPPLELWLVEKQEAYHRQALELLGRLEAFCEACGDFHSAVRYARRMVKLEPWRQTYHRSLMRNLAKSGQRQAALAQYERCRAILSGELGVEPAASTTRLYERIRDQENVSST